MDQLDLTIVELLSLKSDNIWKSSRPIPASRIKGISTDSRTIKSGELFFAIKGDRFDGHDYIGQIFAKGACAAVVSQTWYERNGGDFAGAALVVVPDPLVAFMDYAGFYRRKFDIPGVAITGSSGKTTTKEMAYAVLSQRYSVLRNEKSYNNFIGTPKTIFRLKPHHEIIITEVGTNSWGELERLSYITQPDVCVLTNIGYAHLEHFRDLKGVLRAKMELFAHAMRDGTAIYNADDAILNSQRFPLARTISFGKTGDVTAEIIGCDHLARYTIKFDGETIELGIPGRHNVENAMAAAAIGRAFSLSAREIKGGLEKVQSVEKRLQVYRVSGVTIVDDTYNGNPSSCLASMKTLADMKTDGGGRRIAVFGDMLELGDFAVAEHIKLADAAVHLRIDALFLYGALTGYTAERARRLNRYTVYEEDKEKLTTALCDFLRRGDVLLIKGSRGMMMETVVESCRAFLSEKRWESG
jgi:UDP-N-acetylmuramoyl-tripeptide--D-alanyl-D-alanine ligase